MIGVRELLTGPRNQAYTYKLFDALIIFYPRRSRQVYKKTFVFLILILIHCSKEGNAANLST